MKILVTGGSGFIGKHLVKQLVKKSKVRCLVRKNSNTDGLEGTELVYGELTDKSSLDKAVDGVDVVYHLGAVLGSKGESRELIWDVNVNGTRNILDACYNAKIKKFIHFSTFLVYGYTKEPANEEMLYKADTTFYGVSKRESEIIVREFAREKNMDTVIIQPTIIHGPGLNFGFNSLFPAIQNGKFMFIGDGTNLQHLGYIDNFIEGVLLAGSKKEAIGQTYIIGDERPMTFNEMVKAITDILNVKAPRAHLNENIARVSVFPLRILSKLTGTRALLDHKRINFMVKNQAGNISKIKKELGYKPKISSREGLERTIKYYKETGFLK
jgi:nucleoside-diphosphate-sugar epimerase